MAHVTFALVSLKGGVGKTTLAVPLASGLQVSGHRTVLLDVDPQGSAEGWAEDAEANGLETPPVISTTGKLLRRTLASPAAEGFDAVVIDTAPRIADGATAAMMVADLVLIPLTPGRFDLRAMAQTLAKLDEARALRPELRAAAVLNKAKKQTKLARETERALRAAGVPMLETVIGDRVEIGEATAIGSHVLAESTPNPKIAEPSRAVCEMRAFARETLAALISPESDYACPAA